MNDERQRAFLDANPMFDDAGGGQCACRGCGISPDEKQHAPWCPMVKIASNERERIVTWMRAVGSDVGIDYDVWSTAIEARDHHTWDPEEHERREALDDIEWAERQRECPYRGPPFSTSDFTRMLTESFAAYGEQVNMSAPLLSSGLIR